MSKINELLLILDEFREDNYFQASVGEIYMNLRLNPDKGLKKICKK